MKIIIFYFQKIQNTPSSRLPAILPLNLETGPDSPPRDYSTDFEFHENKINIGLPPAAPIPPPVKVKKEKVENIEVNSRNF